MEKELKACTKEQVWLAFLLRLNGIGQMTLRLAIQIRDES